MKRYLSPKPKHPRPVLLLTDDMSIGGMERVVTNLCHELKQHGDWSPMVEYFEVPGDATYEDELRAAQVPLHCVLQEHRFSWRRCYQICALALRHRVKVMHTHDLGPLIYGVICKLLLGGKVKIVHTQHSFVHLRENPKYALHERVFSRFVDRLCVVSAGVQEEYRRLGIWRQDACILPNGIPYSPRPVGGEERAAARAKLLGRLSEARARRLGRLRDAHWIVSLARIHPVKGQHHALNLWNRLPAEVRERSALIFVGPPVTQAELRRLLRGITRVENRANVLYVGASLEPDTWLRAASVFLSGSDLEGMPLAPMEAIGNGVPCLLSDIEAHRKFERSADLFPLGQLDLAASKLADWITRLEQEGDAVYRRLWESAAEFRAHHGAPGMAAAYAEIYRSVA